MGKKDGAGGVGTFGHEILRAKHLEKRGSEGAYLFTKSSPPASPLFSSPSSSSPTLINSGESSGSSGDRGKIDLVNTWLWEGLESEEVGNMTLFE